MLKKLLFGALTCLLALSLIGCGGKKEEPKPAADNKPAAQTETKTEAVKVESTADKAILAYAQLYAYGLAEDEKAAGMTEADTKPVEEKVIGDLLKAFSQFPLSDENIQNATANYIQKLHNGMEIKTTLKKDDPTAPVVEVSIETIDQAGAAQAAANSEDLKALNEALQELHAQGITDDQLKENAEFQDAVLQVIDSYTNEIPLKARTSKDFTCEAVQGSDGKMYWAPKDVEALAKFVNGL